MPGSIPISVGFYNKEEKNLVFIFDNPIIEVYDQLNVTIRNSINEELFNPFLPDLASVSKIINRQSYSDSPFNSDIFRKKKFLKIPS